MNTDLKQLDYLRSRTSTKWRRYSPDILPMHIAEMDFEIADEIKSKIIDHVTRSDLGYLGSIPELAHSLNLFSQNRWDWKIDPEYVLPATDVGVAAIEILRNVTRPGDSALINTPVYANFFNWLPEVGLQIHDAPMLRSKEGWQLDLVGIENSFASGVKVFLLCNPQNPVGRVHSRDELLEIAKLSNKYGVTVISDEIHAPLTYPEFSFTPYLSISDSHEFGYTVTSASKAWNLAGLKAALIISGSKLAADRISGIPNAVVSRTSLIGAFAMASAYSDGVEWLDKTIARLNQNRYLVRDLISDHLPKAEFTLPQSSYLAWIDLSRYGLITSWHDFLIERGKIAIVPGQDYGSANHNFVRFNFGTYPEIVHEGITRMAKALNNK